MVDRRAEHAANEDPFPDAVTGDPLPHVHDATTDVRTLDARELQSRARPRGVGVLDGVETRLLRLLRSRR